MDDREFDELARTELSYLEEQFMDVDPDEVEVSSSDGVLTFELRDGAKIVVNSHRAARQIWMAAVASAWHFDPQSDRRWRDGKGDELRTTLSNVIKNRIGLDVAL